MTHPVIELACELLRRPSVTPDDAGCQALIGEKLAAAGFEIEHLRFGEVDNLWAQHGQGGPVLVLLGHTDVVPTGPVEAWSSPPFEPTLRDGLLFGRGSADMKGSVAAMVVALENFVAQHPDHPGTVALLLTSDEEGEAIDGVRRVADHFRAVGQRIDWCLVGEPSSISRLGDRCRAGRRGSLSGYLTVHGVQGHVAYPEIARNPIHELAPVLAELCAQRWDEGSAEFPPTSFQISNIHAGTGANNVIPGSCEAVFNFRFGTVTSADALRARVERMLHRHNLEFSLRWHESGAPFLAPLDGRLRAAVLAAVVAEVGQQPVFDTGGGTSDGRFIAPLGAEVVELGPVNASIHKINEHVRVDDLVQLMRIYGDIVDRCLRWNELVTP